MGALKELKELINVDDPGWPMVQQWAAEARNPVEVLPPPDIAKREQALLASQVTTRSPMGAIVYESGGILVDHGWLRILGSGHPRLPRTLPGWNYGRSFPVSGQRPEFVLVGDDVVGGFFAIDGGGLGIQQKKVCYFAPDTLKWENTEKGYSDFILWAFNGDLNQFYETMRWPGWEKDLRELSGEQVFSIYPLLSSAGPPMSERNRKPVAIAEAYDLHIGRRN